MRGSQNIIVVQSRTPPVIEIDTAVRAAYVRFKLPDTRVVRTQQVEKPGVYVGAGRSQRQVAAVPA